ncbi:MAG: GNAT family N-acetyltransferase [Candidatus Hydrogenedentes bacterium]|nr:GNAT family N-acetyltransferase [Candidatus Hydrogenedentota bacterium]
MSDIPDVPLPAGYSIRTFLDGDEAALAQIYAASRLDKDTVEAVRRDVLGDPCFKPERVFVAEFDGKAVGTGSAWITDGEPGVGYLHMLGVLNDHRGKRLGVALTCACLRYTRDEGLDTQRLMTDDWREDAIRLYLDLGYDPLIMDRSHPMRWEAIGKRLGRTDVLARMRRPPLAPNESFLRRLRRIVGFVSIFGS